MIKTFVVWRDIKFCIFFVQTILHVKFDYQLNSMIKKQEAHRSHRSPKKPVQINEYICAKL